MSEPIPVPGWYAAMIGPPCVSHEDSVAGRLPRAARAFPRAPAPVRGALLWLATRRAPLVALIRNAPGTAAFLALEGLRPGGRRVVLLEFIGRPPARRAPLRLAGALRARLEGLALRRCLAAAQVLTAAEAQRYPAELGLPRGLFHTVPWPLSRTGGKLPPEPPPSRRVVSSGRAYCDWDTLLAAARGRDWDLTLICSEGEEATLRRRAAGAARVAAELPREEHDALLREAAVYALVLHPTSVSAGQVRLAAAVDSGIAVVATDVPALEGYASPESALLVPPSDPVALGDAVDRLLADPAERRRLREAARARGRTWTYDEYFAAVGDLLAAAAAQTTGTP
ncbi:MAG TPA: glycosyltransferase [Solirubrobacterales bacterium]|nr:glycosyltransferase [Solirubrobacterales bacterium]